MNCFKCKKELLFEEYLLKDFVACPYCGAFFPKIVEPIENGSIEAELKKLADEFGGLEIFSEENASRFAKSLAKLNSPFDVARDKLLVANIKKIPQRLYSVIEQTQNEKQQMADLCFDEMISFGLPQEFAKETIAWLTQVMRFSVNLERKPLIEKNVVETKVTIRYSENRFFSSALTQKKTFDYKSCTIGKQEWFAVNFHNTCGRSKSYDDYGDIGIWCTRKEYGRLYNWLEASKNAPEGWRLPTIEDFRDLVHHIQSLGYDSGTALKSTNQWHGESDQGLDLFGFCAYPTVLKNGESQAWFWTASATGEIDYPHYCVCLSANNNELNRTSKVTDDYQACVRYVRDIE